MGIRYGVDTYGVIEEIKRAVTEKIQPALPEGVEFVTTYDRSELIERSIDNLTETLIEEMIIVSLVCVVFLWHMRTLEDYLVQGTFDQFLLRPVSPFVMFLGREVQYLGVADFAIGAGGSSLAYVNLGLQWGPGHWAFLVLAVLCGAMIETTISLMIACIAFWTGRSRRANQLVMQVNVMVQYYPVDIFGLAFRVVGTGLIPVAVRNY